MSRIQKTSTFAALTTIAGLSAAILSGPAACKREESFPDLGDKLASPVDVVTAPGSGYFYVLSADFDRTYNAGSLLVIDTDGNKKTAIPVPRLGRTISLAGNDMLVTFDADGTSRAAEAILYDVSTPESPREVTRIDLPCSPLNTVMRPGYKHFAVACDNAGDAGGLLIGTLADDRTQTGVKLVRSYGTARRAMHLDTVNELLFAFPTDYGTQTWMDLDLDDALTYAADGSETAVPNEIPDEYERTRRARSNLNQRHIYQFIVYDLAAERSASPEPFPFRDSKSTEVMSEFRWTYFNPDGFAGVADSDAGLTSTTATRRYYRTNFFGATPDPDDGAAFYLSHRGHIDSTTGLGSPQANDILRVAITGNPRTGADGKAPFTNTYLKFDRVYGRGAEDNAKGLHYPGDIEVQRVNGEKMLFVNHFRDLVNWARSQVYFGVAAKSLGHDYWSSELGSSDPYNSYFQIAVTPTGRAAVCSFYGNKVILFDVLPGTAITERLIIQ